MDPFVTLANQYVNSSPGLGHSALPNAPQLPPPAARRRPLEAWRRLLAGTSDRSTSRPLRSRATTRLAVRSAHMARGE